MVAISLSRGATSVSINLWQEGGELLIAEDVGKPTLDYYPVAREDPRSADHKSAIQQFTIVGSLDGSSAYADALTLAESLVKPHSDGTGLTLDLTNVTGYSSTYEVGVPSDRALELDYRPGLTNRVDVQLTLPVVDETIG